MFSKKIVLKNVYDNPYASFDGYIILIFIMNFGFQNFELKQNIPEKSSMPMPYVLNYPLYLPIYQFLTLPTIRFFTADITISHFHKNRSYIQHSVFGTCCIISTWSRIQAIVLQNCTALCVCV